jgi:regulator of protease activity HflC (stomatin/prohibitin superfamily)
MDEDTNIFQKPLFQKLIRFGVFLIAYLLIELVLRFVDAKADHSLEIISDVTLCIAGMIGWMVFFAQFVLPVNNLRDRWKVVNRLVNYLLGGHGPAIFVENGFSHASEGESKKKGPGVIWLDSASAAVLRTTGRFTRTIGPGVHFTNNDEYIAATADLHTLTQTIGANETDEPFKILENDPNYRATKERAEVTSAMTRDGITVSASISVNFRIKSSPGEGNTKFGFNPKSTEAAIRDSMIREAKLEHPVWNSLPARMAADIWREYLGKFRLSELFEKSESHPDTTIQFINDMLKKRLTISHVELLDPFGKVVLENNNQEKTYLHYLKVKNKDAAESLLKKTESTEFIKLSEMGLEIKSVTIKKLFFAPEIEEQLINQWTALWLKNAQTERDQVELDRKLQETTGQQEGLKDFALNASREIARQSPVSAAHALEMLVDATSQGIQQNRALFKRLNTEQHDLSEISRWLRNLREPSQ